jgi:hypothetical protein
MNNFSFFIFIFLIFSIFSSIHSIILKDLNLRSDNEKSSLHQLFCNKCSPNKNNAKSYIYHYRHLSPKRKLFLIAMASLDSMICANDHLFKPPNSSNDKNGNRGIKKKKR